MKKIFFYLILILFISDVSHAQTFSAALGGGGHYGSKTVVRNGQVVRTGAVKKPTVRKKTVIKYEPNQTHLTEAQMEKLMPLIKRIQQRKTKSLEVIGIAKDYSLIYHRLTSLGRIFQSYTPHLMPDFRDISGPAVVKSNNHTVEFIEYQ